MWCNLLQGWQLLKIFGSRPRISCYCVQTTTWNHHQELFSDLQITKTLHTCSNNWIVDWLSLCKVYWERFLLFAWSLKHNRNWKLKDWLLYVIISKLFQSYIFTMLIRNHEEGLYGAVRHVGFCCRHKRGV